MLQLKPQDPPAELKSDECVEFITEDCQKGTLVICYEQDAQVLLRTVPKALQFEGEEIRHTQEA